MNENEIGDIVVATAIRLHQDLGPGLLESVYEAVLAKLLKDRGLDVQRQVPIPFEYEGMRFEEGFRADILVENKVILALNRWNFSTTRTRNRFLPI